MDQISVWNAQEKTVARIQDVKELEFLKDQENKVRILCSWEMIAPKDLDRCYWDETDYQLQKLKDQDTSFIVNFLAHGNGPFYTSLIDPDFPEKLATFARSFIKRYPESRTFTPVHEIALTAKNCCLNGLWYPHLQNETYFYKALIHQCKGAILAMREIRRVNLKAKFVQTENLEAFEDDRKWLALDILCGRFSQEHPFYERCLGNGIRKEELTWFEDHALCPDVLELIGAESLIKEAGERYQEQTIIEKVTIWGLNQEGVQ